MGTKTKMMKRREKERAYICIIWGGEESTKVSNSNRKRCANAAAFAVRIRCFV